MARGNAYGIPLIITANTAGATKAHKSLKGLIKDTKSFGLTSKLSIGAASVALTAYTKKSIAAALADQKAQKSLGQTLKNLGLQYQTAGVTKYIDNLQRATGVSEDELRPAFQKLVLVLGDVGKAQSALSLAMDISAGTGKDLSAVSMALAKGYSGQTTALSRLGAGLDKALLKSGDMEAITAQLSKLFQGQALTAAKTYAGQMAILSVSAKEASETIGFALINSIVDLGGQDGVKTLASQMEATATATAEVIAGLTTLYAKLNVFPILGKIAGGTSILSTIVGALRSVGRKSNAAKAAKTDANSFDRGLNNRAVDLATKIVAKKKEAAKIDKAAAANTKLQGMFDMDAIQIAAALKGKISELDRKSLEAMQALKTEDKNDDIKALENLEQAKIAADAADRARKIKALQDTISFNKAALDDWQANFDKMNSNATKMLGLSAAAYSVGAPGSTQQTGLQQAQTDLFKGTLPDLSYLTFDLAALGAANAQMDAGIAAQQAANVTVNLQGGINIGSTLEFYQTVQAAVQEATRNGWSLAGTATG
jgi:hypothetical protein